MGVFKVLLIILSGMAVYELYSSFTTVPFPSIDPNPWWAAGSRGKEDVSIRSFKINVPEKDLKDLKDRLNLPSRLAPPLEGANFTYGMNSDTFSKIVTHWKTNYDWRKREAKLNQLNHYKTKIEGLDIHFVRAKPKVASGVTVRPMLLLHGWPSSIVEFVDLIPILTSVAEGKNIAFEVIAPSLPGFGFSDPSAKPGLGPPQMGQIFLKLMKRLGFDQFYVQGGDWGAITANVMGTLYKESVLGIHMTVLSQLTPLSLTKHLLGAFLPSGFVMEASREPFTYPVGKHLQFIFEETGYMHLQATKPDTVGIALSSSPEGLAAYLLEKFITLTNLDAPNLPDGGFNDNFPISIDKILDNINVYWFTRSITSSMRLYAELPKFIGLQLTLIPTDIPTGLACFPNEVYMSPESFAKEKFKNIITYTVHKRGGHFAAMEVPEVLADDFTTFVNLVEKQNKEKTEL